MNGKNGWKRIGPGGGGGQFIPTISPHNPDTVLIGCDMTGGYITHDGGESWREFNLKAGIQCFCFDPIDPNKIYAGSNGLYRSEDNGIKWRLVFPNPGSVMEERKVGDHSGSDLISFDNWPRGGVKAICIDRRKTNHIYVAVTLQYPIRKSAIFFSENNGESFKELCTIEAACVHTIYIDESSPLDNSRIFIFANSGIFTVSPADSIVEELPMPEKCNHIIHASWGVRPASKCPVFYVTSNAKWDKDRLISGVWKSTDMAYTWEALTAVADDKLAGPESGMVPEYTLLAVSERDAANVYLVAGCYPEIPEDCGSGAVISSYGILKSKNEGAAWEWVLKGDVYHDPVNKKGGWCEYSYSPKYDGIGPKGSTPIGIGICSTHPEICYATDIGASYRSLDGGEGWEQVYSNTNSDGTVSSRGLDVTTCYGVHFDPFDKEHIVISYTDLGMFHSKDGGETWRHAIHGIPPKWSNTCYWMVFDPEVKGRAWAAWAYAHDLPRPKMFRGGKFHQAEGGVSKSDDGIMTWQVSNKGMPENSVVTHIVLDPGSPAGSRTLYASVFDKGVFKSTDDGETWECKKEGISGNLNAFRLALLPDGTLYLVVARGLRRGREIDGALYKSINDGDYWEKVRLPAGVNAPNDIAYDPVDPMRMYIACWPRTAAGKEYFGGVYATDDGGETWENIFDPGAHVYGIVIDEDNPSTLFINTFDHSAYRTDDRGVTWSRLRGYNFHWGHRPVIDPYNRDRIYLTTFGSSVWYGPADGIEDAFEDSYPFV